MIARCTIVELALLLLIALLAPASPPTPTERPQYKSPLGLAIDSSGRYAYVALHTADALAVVDLPTGKVVREIPVGRKPHDVALYEGTAYVTCEADDTLVAVDLKSGEVKETFEVGQSPRNLSIDPDSGLIQVVCHDSKVLWKRDWTGFTWTTPIPPQPEGNFARVSNLELTLANQGSYRKRVRPWNLFTHGESIFDAKKKKGGLLTINPFKIAGRLLGWKAKTPGANSPNPAQLIAAEPPPTAFAPMRDLNLTTTAMDLVVHSRPRWFTPTAQAPDGRVFTNGFSFFLNDSMPAAVVLLDEPTKGYPDPTDVVVKLPKTAPGKKAQLTQRLPKPSEGIANHPLSGSRVFISSGGADTVVVLDMDKVLKHGLANPTIIGGFGGMMGGNVGGFGGWNGMPPGGFSGTMNGMMGGPGFQGAQFSGGLPVLGPNPGAPPGGPPGRGGPPAPVPGAGGGPPPVGPGGPPPGGGGGLPPGGFNGMMGMGGGFGGGFGGFGGWNGGFSGIREDLRASASFTLARIPTQANPRRMVLTPDGKTLVVTNHLADSLTLIDTDSLKVRRHIDLGGPKPDNARRGEILFHSAKFTVQQQFTCASCHPGNGSDGLSWMTDPSGKGESFNTRALHGVRDTGPFGWKGDSDTFEARAKNTMREVHKHQLSDAAASSIAAFVETIDPPRPLPQKETDLPAIARGKALFSGKGNCRSCHRGTAFTSDSPRAVILDQGGKWTPFDVPSLRGVARTAPYLHDGRAATLEEIFERHNAEKRHGRAHELTRGELADVIMFLKSL